MAKFIVDTRTGKPIPFPNISKVEYRTLVGRTISQNNLNNLINKISIQQKGLNLQKIREIYNRKGFDNIAIFDNLKKVKGFKKIVIQPPSTPFKITKLNTPQLITEKKVKVLISTNELTQHILNIQEELTQKQAISESQRLDPITTKEKRKEGITSFMFIDIMSAQIMVDGGRIYGSDRKDFTKRYLHKLNTGTSNITTNNKLFLETIVNLFESRHTDTYPEHTIKDIDIKSIYVHFLIIEKNVWIDFKYGRFIKSKVQERIKSRHIFN